LTKQDSSAPHQGLSLWVIGFAVTIISDESFLHGNQAKLTKKRSQDGLKCDNAWKVKALPCSCFLFYLPKTFSKAMIFDDSFHRAQLLV